VPTPLARTAEAAGRLGAGSPVTGFSAKALSLAEGVTRTMLPNKLKGAIALLLATLACAVGLGTGLGGFAGPPAEKPPRGPSGKASPASTGPKKTTDNSIKVSGRVVDADARPVAGAKFAVIADETGAAVPQVVSGSDGRFTFQLPRFR